MLAIGDDDALVRLRVVSVCPEHRGVQKAMPYILRPGPGPPSHAMASGS